MPLHRVILERSTRWYNIRQILRFRRSGIRWERAWNGCRQGQGRDICLRYDGEDKCPADIFIKEENLWVFC